MNINSEESASRWKGSDSLGSSKPVAPSATVLLYIAIASYVFWLVHSFAVLNAVAAVKLLFEHARH